MSMDRNERFSEWLRLNEDVSMVREAGLQFTSLNGNNNSQQKNDQDKKPENIEQLAQNQVEKMKRAGEMTDKERDTYAKNLSIVGKGLEGAENPTRTKSAVDTAISAVTMEDALGADDDAAKQKAQQALDAIAARYSESIIRRELSPKARRLVERARRA